MIEVQPVEALITANVGDTITFRFKTEQLATEMVAWSPSQKKAQYNSEVKQGDGFTEFLYPVTVAGSYLLFIGEMKALRGEALVGYKLQIENKHVSR